MAFHLIEEKAEDALQTALLTCTGDTLTDHLAAGGELAGWYVYKGFSNTEKSLPYVSITAPSAEALYQDTSLPPGNWAVSLVVTMVSHVNDKTRADHSSTAGTVRDYLVSVDLKNWLNQAGVSGFAAYRAFLGETSREVDEDLVKTETELVVWCHPGG